MKKKVFIAYVAAAVIALLALISFEYAFWTTGIGYMEDSGREEYLVQAELLSDLLMAQEVSTQEEFEEFADEYSGKYDIRITIIDDEGDVLGESEGAAELLDNHLDREEVISALAGENTSVIRESETYGIEYCYCAVLVEYEDFTGVLRVAVPLTKLHALNGHIIQSMLLTLVLLLGVTFFIFFYFRRYVNAMNKVENMRREFVSNVTHELKTPLTSIRGFVETLKSGAIEDPKIANKFLDIIEIETDRLTNLIGDTLLLSEIESGKDTKKERVPCDINEVATEVVELLQPKVKEHVRLIFHPDKNLRLYSCNRDHIKELLINLVDNGLKATEFGAVTITCKSTNREMVIVVSDTGIGMEEEQLDRIFERFYRVDKGRSKAQGGTGLGLSIVKHIVELYNGTIDVTSKPGVGSEFTVRLPY